MTSGQRHQILVGTSDGLYEFGPEERTQLAPLAGREITALARDGARAWALLDSRKLWRTGDDGSWEEVASAGHRRATCLAVTAAGLIVGTEAASLLRLEQGELRPVSKFDDVEGRDTWHTPWGDPAEVRSISSGADGAVYVNVHVGGVVRSTDGGRSWRPTLDIETDVHQVLAHPVHSGVVLVAAAVGFGVSEDCGETWRVETAGLHAEYARAIAISDDVVLLSASTGPSGRRAALYRKPIGAGGPFARCQAGLPDWFRSNIDTGCLAAAGSTVAFATGEGSVFLSADSGERWDRVAKGLPPVQCLVLG